MSGLALGMIETKGLVAAIEAADAALKAADVRLVSREKVKGAIINIKIVGDVAAVRSAVDAGSAAASKVGELLSSHVIPSPVEDLDRFIYEINYSEKEIPITNTGSEEIPEKDSELSDVSNEDENDDSGQLVINYTGLNSEDEKYLDELKNMSVPNLRKLARDTEGLEIAGRQISIANKGRLIQELMRIRLEK